MWRVINVVGVALFLMTCDKNLPEENICFSDDVVPLVQRDCSPCHANGEYRIELKGRSGEYDEIMRYITPFEPDISTFITWANGNADHPPIWVEGSSARNLVDAWVREGASEVCFDHTRFGECRFDDDCPVTNCVCPDGDIHENVQVCNVEASTLLGTCARHNTCEEERFEICEGTEADGDGDVDADADADADADGDSDADVVEEYCGDGICQEDETYLTCSNGGCAPSCSEDCDHPTLSFSVNIVPLLRNDCASCHYYGQWNVRIRGTVDDYPEVMRYVDLDDPEGVNSFLWWSAGGRSHPYSWPLGTRQYNMFLAWVLQGAENN